jgi:hypothetical protein
LARINVFLATTASFLSLPLLCLIALFCYKSYQCTHSISDLDYRGRTTFFIGDSHVQNCVNDSIVDKGITLSVKAESYYFSYFKIRRLLEHNARIRRIYLGFSYHNLSSANEDFVFGRYSKDIASRYFFILPISEQFRLLSANKHHLYAFIKKTLLYKPSAFLGGYENNSYLSAVVDSSVSKRIKFHYYNGTRLAPVSAFNLQYFDKIIRLCSRRGIQLTLLNTPLHPLYTSRIPSQYTSRYQQLVARYKLPIVDFKNIPFDDSCYIPDGDHVSVKGAVIASTFLEQQLSLSIRY